MQEKRIPREQLGVVSRLLPEEGFGFILGDDQESYFFHARGVRGKGFDDSERFFEGARVRFISADTPKGPRALNVVALGGERVEVDGNVATSGEAGEEEGEPNA